MKKNIWTVLKMTTLLFFFYLMINITVPYLSLKRDESFLQIKYWIVENNTWRIAFFTHVFSSIFLLPMGFTQFFSPINNRFVRIHRAAGKMYIFIILFISGPAGLIMSWYANGGIVSQVAFLVLCTLWIFTTAKAWQQIMRANYVEHGNYMIRSYALTLSAVTLRAWKYIIVLVLHPHPMDVYMIVAWLGWVPNIIVAEIIIRRNYARRVLQTDLSSKPARTTSVIADYDNVI